MSRAQVFQTTDEAVAGIEDGSTVLVGGGEVVYRKTARNFGPVMATAARTTIVQVTEVVPVGALDPEACSTSQIRLQA